MEPVMLIGLLVLAAAIGEGIIEFIPAPLMNLFLPDVEENRPLRAFVLNTLSALLGVGIALNFDLGLFSLLGVTGQIAFLDSVLTGVLIGRGSNYAHGFIKKFILEHP